MASEARERRSDVESTGPRARFGLWTTSDGCVGVFRTQRQTAAHPMRAPLTEALDATLLAIEVRAKLYRRTVIAVAAVIVVSGLAAAILRSWAPLSALILAVPVSGTFFVLDDREVRRWRRLILGLRDARALDVDAFVESISAHSIVPQQTLQGMLALLPRATATRAVTLSMQQRVVPLGRPAPSDRHQSVKTIAFTAVVTALLIGFASGILFRSGLLAVGSALGLLALSVIRAFLRL